jgi:hypothetical protein
MRMNVILKIEGSVCGVWEEWRSRLTWIAREFQHQTNGKLTRPLDLEQHLLISLLLRAVGVLLQMMDPSHHGISVLQFAFGGFFPSGFVLRLFIRDSIVCGGAVFPKLCTCCWMH